MFCSPGALLILIISSRFFSVYSTSRYVVNSYTEHYSLFPLPPLFCFGRNYSGTQSQHSRDKTQVELEDTFATKTPPPPVTFVWKRLWPWRRVRHCARPGHVHGGPSAQSGQQLQTVGEFPVTAQVSHVDGSGHIASCYLNLAHEPTTLSYLPPNPHPSRFPAADAGGSVRHVTLAPLTCAVTTASSCAQPLETIDWWLLYSDVYFFLANLYIFHYLNTNQ